MIPFLTIEKVEKFLNVEDHWIFKEGELKGRASERASFRINLIHLGCGSKERKKEKNEESSFYCLNFSSPTIIS